MILACYVGMGGVVTNSRSTQAVTSPISTDQGRTTPAQRDVSTASTPSTDTFHLDPPLDPKETTPTYWQTKVEKFNNLVTPFLNNPEVPEYWKQATRTELSQMQAGITGNSISTTQVAQLRQQALHLRTQVLNLNQAIGHHQAVQNSSDERIGYAGEMGSRMVMGAAIATLAVGTGGASASITASGVAYATIVGTVAGGVAGGMTEARTQQVAYGRITNEAKVAAAVQDGAVNGAISGAVGSVMPLNKALKGVTGGAVVDASAGFVGGSISTVLPSLRAHESKRDIVKNMAIGGAVGAATAVTIGVSVAAFRGIISPTTEAVAQSAAPKAEEALDQGMKVVLWPKNAHMEATDGSGGGDVLRNLSRTGFIPGINQKRIAEPLSLAIAEQRAAAGGKGIFEATLRVSESELKTLQRNITDMGAARRLQSCSSGVFGGINRSTGLNIPPPFNQTSTLGFVYLKLLQMAGNNRIESIRYIGKNPISDSLGASTLEIAAGFGVAGYIVMKVIDAAGESSELVMPLQVAPDSQDGK